MYWLLPLKRYARFSGRSGRAEYWQFILALVIANAIVFVFEYADAQRTGYFDLTLSYGLSLATLVPTYAVTFRRLHDRNLSGWLVGGMFMLNGITVTLKSILANIYSTIVAAPFMLAQGIVLVATLGLAIYLLVQVCRPGDDGDNRFGPPPHDRDAADTAKLQSSMAEMNERRRAASAAPPAPSSDPVAMLERLSKLHASGALTDAEFEAQKSELLRRL